MRIRRVTVAGLFGVFDHDIPLRMDERITLIHGPNGYGKTVILRLLAGVFGGTHAVLRSVPFTTFSVHFDDGSELRVEKAASPAAKKRGRSQRPPEFTARLLSPLGDELQTYTPNPKDEIKWRRMREYASHYAASRHGLVQVSPWEWRDPATGESIPFETLAERYPDLLPFRPDDVPAASEQRWFHDLRKKIQIRLIRAQRLDVLHRPTGEERPTSVPTVKMYSEEIAGTMQAVLAGYASKSQELDRTFPTRLFRQAAPSMSVSDLEKKMAELEQKRSWLMELGFLDPEPGLSRASRKEVDEKRDVLSIYVADVEQKLGTFDEFAAKVSLLTRIVNARFRYKQMSIVRDRGFVLTSDAGALLQPTDLSSGEQHELVMLYELLFKTEPNSLVMIDEPEISLHIAWQEEFLNDLKRIVDISGFDVLIATHSPEIIGEHLSLAVELKGPPTRSESVRVRTT